MAPRAKTTQVWRHKVLQMEMLLGNGYDRAIEHRHEVVTYKSQVVAGLSGVLWLGSCLKPGKWQHLLLALFYWLCKTLGPSHLLISSDARCLTSSKQTAVWGWGWGKKQWLLSRDPGSLRANYLSTNKAHNTGLLQHTVLSMCIGTHGQKNIRLTGASIVFRGACRSPSTLIIHGHVHDGPGPQLCQQADRHRYGPALLSVNVLFYYVLKPHMHLHVMTTFHLEEL